MSAGQLAEELEVSRRTILRDVEALGNAGVPIYSIRGPQGGFELWRGFRSQLTGLNEDEAESLFLMGMPAVARLLGLGDALDRAGLKLLESLPPGARSHAESSREHFLHDIDPWDAAPPVESIAFFASTIRRRRVVAAAVAGGPEVVHHPLALVLKAGEWYLVTVADGQVAAHPVADFTAARTTGSRFERPADFHLGEFWLAYASSDVGPAPAPPQTRAAPVHRTNR